MNVRVLPGLVLAFALVSLPCVLSAQQPMVRNCEEIEWTLTQDAQQGGYDFDHRSGRGHRQASERPCRVYQIRNAPGAAKTPVKWEDIDRGEVFFNTNLRRCDGSDPCTWLTNTKISAKTLEGETLLGYGVNKDEYQEQPDAYRELETQISGLTAGDQAMTLVDGIIAGPSDESLEIVIRAATDIGYELPDQVAYILEGRITSPSFRDRPPEAQLVWQLGPMTHTVGSEADGTTLYFSGAHVLDGVRTEDAATVPSEVQLKVGGSTVLMFSAEMLQDSGGIDP